MADEDVFPSSVRIEVKLSGGGTWTEIPDVQISSPIDISRGMSGTTQKDRVADTGSMKFVLNNAEDNSEGLLGLYSPNNANCLIGWRAGIPVRCVVTYNGTDYVVFVGIVEDIVPGSGKYGDRKVSVNCTDWMEEAANSKILGLDLQISQRSSKVFTVVAAGVERQPEGGYNVRPGADVFQYALDSAHEGELNAMSEFQRIAMSELGRIWVDRQGTVQFEGRHYRPNLTALFIEFTDADFVGVDAGRGRGDIINHVEVQVHPRRVDATPTTVLSELAGAKQLKKSTTDTVNLMFRDPQSRATRVGGLDMLQPVATTDYLFNTKQDGTGVDITNQLTVSVDYSANGGLATITNNGPQDGYLTKLQTRGRGIYDYETVFVTADSAASRAKYGGKDESFDMPYQSNYGVARDAAQFMLQQSKEILTQVQAVRFWANVSDRLMIAALTGDISKKISLSETVIGSSAVVLTGEDEGQVQEITAKNFFINAVQLSIGERGIIQVTWTLEPADPFTYWHLGIPGFTELNQTTRLGFGSFVAAWVLNADQLGIGTRLAQE